MASSTLGTSSSVNTTMPLPSPAIYHRGNGPKEETNLTSSTSDAALAKSGSIEPSRRTIQATQATSQIQVKESVKGPLAPPTVSAIGITVLYNPPEAINVAADVVFVHGLQGHPLNTWLSGEIPEDCAACQGRKKQSLKASSLTLSSKLGRKKEAKNSQDEMSYCYWPLRLVPKDFQNVRITTYDYYSHPTHWYV